MRFEEFIGLTTKKLTFPLPGNVSQLKMASMPRVLMDGRIIVPRNVRKGGVLVLFYPSNGRIFIVLIKRTEYPGVHSGQISFPGGGWEFGDKDMISTALREAQEEINVDKNKVTTMGTLTELFIPPSNFLVTPVVGFTPERPDFSPDPNEVDRIIEISIDDLLDHHTIQEQEITISAAVRYKVPCFYVDGNVIWGATAMMLHELIDVISREL